jgi:hypothetical protein
VQDKYSTPTVGQCRDIGVPLPNGLRSGNHGRLVPHLSSFVSIHVDIASETCLTMKMHWRHKEALSLSDGWREARPVEEATTALVALFSGNPTLSRRSQVLQID